MGSQLIWIPLILLIYTYMEQVQGNHKMHDTSLEPGQAESVLGRPVIPVDLSPKLHNRLCKCKVNGRWEENNFCPCTKSAQRKNRRARLKKLCQRAKMKHQKPNCRHFTPIVPI